MSLWPDRDMDVVIRLACFRYLGRAAIRSFLMRHGQMSAEVALAFRRAARDHPGHELTEWECDWAAAMKLGSRLIVPDARIVYQTRHWEFSAFLEVDLATEGTRFFARKIE